MSFWNNRIWWYSNCYNFDLVLVALVLTEAELELLDGLTAGTAITSKVVTTDANIDSTGMRNLTNRWWNFKRHATARYIR